MHAREGCPTEADAHGRSVYGGGVWNAGLTRVPAPAASRPYGEVSRVRSRRRRPAAAAAIPLAGRGARRARSSSGLMNWPV